MQVVVPEGGAAGTASTWTNKKSARPMRQCANAFTSFACTFRAGRFAAQSPADVRSPAVAILPVRGPSIEVVGRRCVREYDLCIICFRATAGGASKFSWLACADCRAVNQRLGRLPGVRGFALGRHSFMNGIAVRLDAPPEVQSDQLDRLRAFSMGDDRLRDGSARNTPTGRRLRPTRRCSAPGLARAVAAGP